MVIAEAQKIRVVVVDDQEVIREAFGMLIAQEPSIDLVGSLSPNPPKEGVGLAS